MNSVRPYNPNNDGGEKQDVSREIPRERSERVAAAFAKQTTATIERARVALVARARGDRHAIRRKHVDLPDNRASSAISNPSDCGIAGSPADKGSITEPAARTSPRSTRGSTGVLADDSGASGSGVASQCGANSSRAAASRLEHKRGNPAEYRQRSIGTGDLSRSITHDRDQCAAASLQQAG